MELAPKNAEVLSGAGTLAYALGRVEEAISLTERALERDPLSSVTYNRLGLTLHRANRYAEAEAAYRRALELAPQRGGTRAYLAFPLLAQGRATEALAMANAEPVAWVSVWLLAIIHHALGNVAESEEALQELIRTRGDDAQTQIAEAYGRPR